MALCVCVCVGPTFVSIFTCTLVYLYHHLSLFLSLSFLLGSFLLCLSLVLLSLRRLPSLSVAFNGALACNFICEKLLKQLSDRKRKRKRGEEGRTGGHVLAFNKYFKCCVVFCFSRPAIERDS